MRRPVLLAVCATMLAVAVAPSGADPGPYGRADTLPPSAPVGWAPTFVTVTPTPTSLSFSPSGDTLYVATTDPLSGSSRIVAYPMVAGLVAGPPSVFLGGLTFALGVLATADGVFVSALGTSTTGRVLRATDANGDRVADSTATVISGLPIGRHNTNGLALGPDGMLYFANGNRTDSGFGNEGGPAEIRPYSGSVLRVNPAATGLVPQPSMVVATGFRNIYDIAFFPGSSIAAVPMNGPDGLRYGSITRPAGEDTLSVFETADAAVEHFGFPWCLYDRNNGGLAGFTQSASQGQCTPLPPAASTGLLASPVQAYPSALFGLHVSADGCAFDPGVDVAEGYDLYVTEWGNLFGTVPLGHKIVRVRFNSSRAVTSVDDFMTGGAPLDLTFAPDGAMWIADYAGLITRLQPVL